MPTTDTDRPKRSGMWRLYAIAAVLGGGGLWAVSAWMHSYAATTAGRIRWECYGSECSTNDPRSMIPVVGWALIVVVCFVLLFLPGSGFFPGLALVVFAWAWIDGHTLADAAGLATNGTLINGLVAAGLGVVLMILGMILTLSKVRRGEGLGLGSA